LVEKYEGPNDLGSEPGDMMPVARVCHSGDSTTHPHVFTWNANAPTGALGVAWPLRAASLNDDREKPGGMAQHVDSAFSMICPWILASRKL
jgi:hypothetical protein